ncbi:MAG TPA: hypothetical protein VMF60_07915 [Acidimicrobiales bacterium]|nr:hypothetical protein [Acidimicrobiales bacterium]
MTPTPTPRRRGRRVLVAGAVLVVAVLAAGCGGSKPSASSGAVLAGQVPKSQLPASGSGSKDASASSTIPLAQQNPISALFSSLSTFQSCLQGLGVTFVGVPNSSDPSSPANNPQYVKNLTTCAAQSNILQSLKAAQSAQDNLTPAQIHTENNEYLKWRTCMIGRGWGIPQPTPNSQGLLFSFGGTGGSVPNFTPPAGKSILSSSDMEACASKVTNGAIS